MGILHRHTGTAPSTLPQCCAQRSAVRGDAQRCAVGALCEVQPLAEHVPRHRRLGRRDAQTCDSEARRRSARCGLPRTLVSPECRRLWETKAYGSFAVRTRQYARPWSACGLCASVHVRVRKHLRRACDRWSGARRDPLGRPYTDVRTLGENRRPVGDARAVPQEHAVGPAQLEVALRVVPLLLALAYVAAPSGPHATVGTVASSDGRQPFSNRPPPTTNTKANMRRFRICTSRTYRTGSDHCRTLPQYCGGTAAVPTGTACCRQLARARTWRKLDRRQRKH